MAFCNSRRRSVSGWAFTMRLPVVNLVARCEPELAELVAQMIDAIVLLASVASVVVCAPCQCCFHSKVYPLKHSSACTAGGMPCDDTAEWRRDECEWGSEHRVEAVRTRWCSFVTSGDVVADVGT